MRDIDLLAHGDDFVSAGSKRDLKWTQSLLEASSEIGTTVVGHEEGTDRQANILNHIVQATGTRFTHEADARPAELIAKNLGLEGGKSVIPSVSDESHEPEDPPDHEQFKKYQSICARANVLAVDRVDIQYAAKECCREVSRPTRHDWVTSKRLGRYLLGKPRMQWVYSFQDNVGEPPCFPTQIGRATARTGKHQRRDDNA